VHSSVHKIVSTQISLDLILLTVLLHFSGGIENPFMIYFVFHMVIASILLPAWESFLQAVLAVFLLVLLALLEYEELLIEHRCLEGLVTECIYRDGRLIAAIVFAFGTAIFMIVYMTSSIASQSRNQEEAYWEANIELKEKDKVKDEYVARVTHDIKGHLAAIQSCLEVVSNKTLGPLNDRQGEFVDRAQKRTQKLSTFVRTLLRLTQMRLSKRLDMQEFSLNEVVENTIAAASSRAKSKSVALSFEVGESVGTMVGNRFSIEEMLMNLILNAIKYTNENGTVEIVASKDDGFYEVEVSDNGIGIPSADVEHVFEEFYRASNAKKVERDGTGLGLSIVKQIVERHGGTVGVESRVGYGSTFKFRLPLNCVGV
jgi:signal transduction histidine kinase